MYGVSKRVPSTVLIRATPRCGAVCLLYCALVACAVLPESVIKRDGASSLGMPKTFQADQEKNSPIIEGLSTLFGSNTLDGLVEQALNANLDIHLAAQQLEEAGFVGKAQLGSLLPQVTGNFSANRAEVAGGKPENTYTPFLDVSWELDVWGKLRAQKASLDATTKARVANYQAARDSVAAQVMQAWFDAVTAEKQVALAQSRLGNLQKSARTGRRNYEAGLGQLDDLAAVERDAAQTKVTLAENKSVRNSTIRTLQVLLGQYPGGEMALTFELPKLLAPPAAGLPANLLVARPDLRGAWQDVLAADETVKVAHKQMFPSLVLTGSLGTQSSVFSEVMSGATIWSLANSLTMPLFNAGQLKNNMEAAQSRAEQAWVRYLQIALTAFQEVEQALDRETNLAVQEEQQNQALIYAKKTERIFERRYKNGLVSILEYLTVQNVVFDMKSQLLDVRNKRLKNRVALALALGKGV